MNVVKEIERITEEEVKLGIFAGITKGSWHDKYNNSAWVYVGGLSYELSEGDILCVMSQWGEIEDINLVRDKENKNKSKGFAFIKYEDQRSTILAVDNFNGTKLLDRTVRCDHVDKYRLPKEVREREEELLEHDPTAAIVLAPGHAYAGKELATQHNVKHGQDVWAPVPDDVKSKSESSKKDKSKKRRKEEKSHKEKKHKHKHERHDDDEGQRTADFTSSRYASNTDERSDHVKSIGIVPINHINGSRDNFPSSSKVNGNMSNTTSNPMTTSTLPSMTNFPVGESVASWRGNRDPAAGRARPSAAEFAKNDGGAKGGASDNKTSRPRSDELAGYGGINRNR